MAVPRALVVLLALLCSSCGYWATWRSWEAASGKYHEPTRLIVPEHKPWCHLPGPKHRIGYRCDCFAVAYVGGEVAHVWVACGVKSAGVEIDTHN